MRIACPNCHAAYNVDERRIPAAGLNVRCPKCQSAFPVRPPAPAPVEPEAVPLPTAGGGSAEGMGGSTLSFDSPFAGAPATPRAPPGATGEFASPFGAPGPAAARAAPAPQEGLGGSTMRFQAPAELEKPAVTPPWGTVPLPSPPPGAVPIADGFGPVPAAPVPSSAPSSPPLAPPPPPSVAAPARPPFAPPTPPPFAPPTPPPFAPPTPPHPAAQTPLPSAPLGFGEVDLARPGGPADPTPYEVDEPLPAATDVPPPDDPFASPAEPPPPAPGPAVLGRAEAEELEALFEESAAGKRTAPPPAPSGPSWRIRRRSGRIFGPFPQPEVVLMLSRGELLGNEEVSKDDGQSWSAIGQVPAFAEAIQKLIERPQAEMGSGARLRSPALLVPGEPPLEARPSAVRGLLGRLPRWARYALPAAAGLLVIGLGLLGGLTDHGIFFHRTLRGQVGPGRPGARLCTEARARFAEDTWPAGRAALELAQRAVALSPVDREAKGIYAQVAFWMARRTGAPPEVLAQAQAWLAEVRQRSPQAPDTLKAAASASLAAGSPVPAPERAALETYLARAPSDEDAVFLLGELALAAGDLGRAEGLFRRAEQQRPGARSAHALGLVAAARGDAAGAVARFNEALQREPGHLGSRVEAAALALATGDVTTARQKVEAALAAGARDQLGPRERSRARQLRGELLAREAGGDDAERRFAETDKEFEAALQEDPANGAARAAWARYLLRRHVPDRALAALQPVVASGGPEVTDLQVRALAAAGRALDATQLLEAALAKWPGNARLLHAQGVVLEAGGKRAEARQAYAAAARDPAAWESRLALGRMRLRDGDAAGAAPDILAAAERAPAEPDAQAVLAELRLAKGDAAGADQAWRQALLLDPGHAPSHLGLARIALDRGDLGAALGALEKAVRYDPKLVEARLTLGGLKWQKGDLEGAAGEFRAAAAADPRSALARTRLGAVELEQGKTDAALEDLYAASNVEAALAENRYWLGRALLAKGDAAQAVDQLARAVELDPGSAPALLWLGQAQERGGKPVEAGESYRQALARDPRLVEAAERQGLLLSWLNRPAEAVTWFEKALQLAPREQRLRMELADCRIKLGQHAQAIQIYREALRADPRLVAAYYRIARAVHESQGAREALPWYEKAAQLEPGNPMPHYYLGFAHKERGRKAQAVAAFREYLRLKPDAEDRKDIEQEIEYLGG